MNTERTLADDLRDEAERLRRRFVHATRPGGRMTMDEAIALCRRMHGDNGQLGEKK